MERGVAGDSEHRPHGLKLVSTHSDPYFDVLLRSCRHLYGQYFTVCTFRGGAWAGLKLVGVGSQKVKCPAIARLGYFNLIKLSLKRLT